MKSEAKIRAQKALKVGSKTRRETKRDQIIAGIGQGSINRFSSRRETATFQSFQRDLWKFLHGIGSLYEPPAVDIGLRDVRTYRPLTPVVILVVVHS
jgi:hypothetical protein